jgi:hypothetical protein
MLEPYLDGNESMTDRITRLSSRFMAEGHALLTAWTWSRPPARPEIRRRQPGQHAQPSLAASIRTGKMTQRQSLGLSGYALCDHRQRVKIKS